MTTAVINRNRILEDTWMPPPQKGRETLASAANSGAKLGLQGAGKLDTGQAPTVSKAANKTVPLQRSLRVLRMMGLLDTSQIPRKKAAPPQHIVAMHAGPLAGFRMLGSVK